MYSRSLGKVLFKVLGAIAAFASIGYGFKDRAEITDIQKNGVADFP